MFKDANSVQYVSDTKYHYNDCSVAERNPSGICNILYQHALINVVQTIGITC